MQSTVAILGIGNILEHDDGIAVYTAAYLQNNFTFTPEIDIINGGVEGINLLNIFMEYKTILILDALDIDDTPGSVYRIPASKLAGYGLNSGGAHELGVLQCLDILELLEKPLPHSCILGIVPHTIDVKIAISKQLSSTFETYIQTILKTLKQYHITAHQKMPHRSLENIIESFKNP